MKVCIEKDPSGAFSVYQENEQPGETSAAPAAAMTGQATMESPEQEMGEQQNKQPARDLKDALLMAGQMLSQPDQGMSDEQSAFDSGMARSRPQPGM